MKAETASRRVSGRSNHRMFKGISVGVFAILGLMVGTMVSVQPAHSASNIENACKMMQERSGWYRSAVAASQKWQVPIPPLLAIIRQESRFNATAAARGSSAYGFAQALDGTWNRYRHAAKAHNAIRTSFADSVNFIAWYMTETRKRPGLPAEDMAGHYLAYREGIAGFRSTRWAEKPRLISIAQKVAQTAWTYEQQLQNCVLADLVPSAPNVSMLPRRKPFSIPEIAPVLPRQKPIDRFVAALQPRLIHGRAERSHR